MGCGNYWANAHGGVWCPCYMFETPDDACENCPKRETKEEASDAGINNRNK